MAVITSHRFTEVEDDLYVELPDEVELGDQLCVELEEEIPLNLADTGLCVEIGEDEDELPLLIDFDKIGYEYVLSGGIGDVEIEETSLTDKLEQSIEFFKANNKEAYEHALHSKKNVIANKNKANVVAQNEMSMSIYSKMVHTAVERGMLNLSSTLDDINLQIMQLDGFKPSLLLKDPNNPLLTVAEQAKAKQQLNMCKNHIALAISSKAVPFYVSDSDSSLLTEQMKSAYGASVNAVPTGLIEAVTIETVINPFEHSLNSNTIATVCSCGGETIVDSLGKVLYGRLLFYPVTCQHCGSVNILPRDDMRATINEVQIQMNSTKSTLPDEHDLSVNSFVSDIFETYSTSNDKEISQEFEQGLKAYVANLRSKVDKVHMDDPNVARVSIVNHIANVTGVGVDGLRDIARGSVAKAHFFKLASFTDDYAVNTINSIISKLKNGEEITYTCAKDFTEHISVLLGKRVKQNQLFDGRAPYPMSKLSLTKLQALTDSPLNTAVRSIEEQTKFFLANTFYFKPEDGKRYDKKKLYSILPNIDALIEPHLLKVALFVAHNFIPLFWKDFRHAQTLITKKQTGAINLQNTDDIVKSSLLLENVSLITNKHVFYTLHSELSMPELDITKLNQLIMTDNSVIFNKCHTLIKGNARALLDYPELVDIYRRNSYAISTGLHVHVLVIDAVCKHRDVLINGAKKIAHLKAIKQLPPPIMDNINDEAFEAFCDFVKDIEAPLNYDVMNAVLGTTYTMQEVSSDNVTVYDIDEMLADFVYDNKYYLQFKEVYLNGSKYMKDMFRKLGKAYDDNDSDK